MADKTKINWSGATWNPWTGCTKISEGCKYCYAHDMAKTLQGWGNKKYEKGMEINLHDGKYLELPMRWHKGRLIFVDSMCDLFHEDVPDEYVDKVWWVMSKCPQHIFQVLTKRAERMQQMVDSFGHIYGTLDNVWLGVTTENQERYDERVAILADTRAALRWISMEPMIGPIDVGLLLHHLDWVIVGGETQPQGLWREMKPEWVRTVRDVCVRYGIPFFFKHWNAKAAKYAEHLLDGVAWEQYPSLERIGK